MFWLLACASKEDLSVQKTTEPEPTEARASTDQPTAPQKTESLSSELVLSGFSTPESALYDPTHDRYIVSNINGGPLDKDDNGFLSLVSPEGKITEMNWISGAKNSYELHAPKGTAIIENELYVADIDTVRVFNLSSGDHIRDTPIEGALFLNDLLAAGQILFCSDMNTGTIHQLKKDAAPTTFLEGLNAPNGITARGQSIYITSFKDPSVMQFKMNGSAVETIDLPSTGLDGIVMTIDGTTYVSSWESSSIYEISSSQEVRTVLTRAEAPADIGWDSKRKQLLVPLFKNDELLIVPTSPEAR